MIPEIFGYGTGFYAWETERRIKILDLFQEHVYGYTPSVECLQVDHTLVRINRDQGDGIEESLLTTRISANNLETSFRSRVFNNPLTPGGPVILMIDPFTHNPSIPHSQDRNYNQFPIDIITRQGYTAVCAQVDEACLDDPDLYQKGIYEVTQSKEGSSTWGAIGVWAWAASRVIDYFSDRRIAVSGFSRGGKSALWCAAQDPRVDLVISSSSGCSGAAMTRGKTGEQIADITRSFPHWMCRKYADYADQEDALPVDQHMLLACIAPRPLYVSSSSEDTWADPYKEFESVVLASSVYALYEKLGISSGSEITLDTTVNPDGWIAYHNRTGEHSCRITDWELYLSFIDKHFQNTEGILSVGSFRSV